MTVKRVVIKLGSSVVADERGELRQLELERICDALASLHTRGSEAIIVTSGAIARGMRVMDLAARPNSIGDLQAASAVGQGKLYRVYDQRTAAADVL
jgi:glutamate 5-kinase